jgi:hypothetical protein
MVKSVIRELVYTAKYIPGKDLAGRNLTVFPDDTFIVSYPRSGNTWTRFWIANLLHPEEPVTRAPSRLRSLWPTVDRTRNQLSKINLTQVRHRRR